MEEQSKVILTYENIPGYFRQSVDYVFLDRVEIIPGVSAEGIKMISGQDWYFKMHFPGNPVMPGVFQMEALMQTGGLIINTMEGKKDLTLMFRECSSARIIKSARPGDILKTTARLLSYKRGIARFKAEATVNDELSCEMEFTHIAPSEIGSMMRKEGESK